MLYVSIVSGLFVGFLVDHWLGRLTVKEPLRMVLAIIVAALVAVFTYIGSLPRF